VKFSALVLTLNEERQIADCLGSLAPAERVIVLDSGSTDRTREIAANFPRVDVHRRAFTDFADQRNAGMDLFKAGTWILHLDADERLPAGLAQEILELAPGDGPIAFNIPSRVSFMGRYLPRSSGYPVYQTRLTRAGSFRFEMFGHGQKAPAGSEPLPYLSEPYDHWPLEQDFAVWIRKQVGYAERDASALRARPRLALTRAVWSDPILLRTWLRGATARMPLRPWLVWLYLMFVRGGVIEGRAGWEYCRRRRIYEGLLDSKFQEQA
jgi:glycosyltransferase involved in cell wall biosynthesis